MQIFIYEDLIEKLEAIQTVETESEVVNEDVKSIETVFLTATLNDEEI
jgi:hypothetical protein